MDLGSALHLDILIMKYKRAATSLIVFVVILILLNLLFSEMDWGVHISILGSLVLTLLVWGIMGAGAKAGGRR